MTPDFLPRADGALLAWGRNFVAVAQASGTDVGLPPAMVTTVAQRFDDFAAALAVANEANTRTRPAVAAKDAARAGFKAYVRLCAKVVHGTPGVSDAQKLSLGLTVAKKSSRVPAPTERPTVQIVEVAGRTVSLRVFDGSSLSRRRKAIGSVGAKLYIWAGEQFPAELSAWHYWGDCTRDACDITFAHTVPGGQRVWVTAVWYTRRGETGPMAAPMMTYLQMGGMVMAAEAMRAA